MESSADRGKPAAVSNDSPGELPASAGQAGVGRLWAVGAATIAALDRCRLEYVYLVVALIWGIMLVVVMPPFQVPDEPVHFNRAWGLSQGDVFPPRDLTERLPTNVWTVEEAFPTGPIGIPDRYEGYEPSRAWRLVWGEEIAGTVQRRVSAVPSQNPVAYVPQAFGVLIARVTRFSPLGAFYLARLFNLLAAVGLTFLALRLLPFGKTMLLLVALFPVTVSEMASTSPDALTMAGAFFFTGLLLNYSQRTTLRNADMALAVVSGAVLLTIKPGYFPLALLVLLIPSSALGPRRRYLLWAGGLIAVVCAMSIIMAFAAPKSTTGVGIGPGDPNADTVAQLKHLFTNPGAFARAMMTSFGTQGVTYAYWTVGLLGWLTISVSHTAVLLLAGAILFFIGGFATEPAVAVRSRVVLLVTFFATLLTMCLSLYAALNPVGGSAVNGIQGRYFIPFLPLGLLAVYRLRLRGNRLAVIVVLAIAAVVAIATMLTIWRHYSL